VVDLLKRMTFPRALALLALIGGAVAACGSGTRPGGSSRAPSREEQVSVSIPVPPPTPPRAAANRPRELQARIDSIAAGFKGRFGIAIRAVDDGWTVEHTARQRLPQQSVSKLWVAMTVLDQRDQGRVRLDDPIVVRPEDLTLFHQPIAFLVKAGGYKTTVGGLLTRALTQSDNTANDRLLTLVGGPSAVRRMIQAKRLGEIRFGPGERQLQAGTAGLTWQPAYAIGNAFQIARSRLSPDARKAALDRYVADPPDGAAPLAIADALARLARGEILSETSTRILLDTMASSVTGRARLRAALPPGWKIAHKTGTGQDLGARNAGFNDVGLLTAPDGRRFALAVMIGDSTRPIRERQMLIQAAAAALTQYVQAHPSNAAGLNSLQ